MERVTAAELNSSGNEKFASQSSVVPFIFSRNKDRYAFDTRLTLETSQQAGVSIFVPRVSPACAFSIYLSLFSPTGKWHELQVQFSLSLSLSPPTAVPGRRRKDMYAEKWEEKRREISIFLSLPDPSKPLLVLGSMEPKDLLLLPSSTPWDRGALNPVHSSLLARVR